MAMNQNRAVHHKMLAKSSKLFTSLHFSRGQSIHYITWHYAGTEHFWDSTHCTVVDLTRINQSWYHNQALLSLQKETGLVLHICICFCIWPWFFFATASLLSRLTLYHCTYYAIRKRMQWKEKLGFYHWHIGILAFLFLFFSDYFCFFVWKWVSMFFLCCYQRRIW